MRRPCRFQSLRERVKRQPEGLPTFYARSLLGRALLGQKKHAEAEPLLLQGYEGVKQRAARIPEQVRHGHLAALHGFEFFDGANNVGVVDAYDDHVMCVVGYGRA